MRAGLLDRRSDLRLLVGGEVIEHDHIAALKRGHQDLFHIGAEGDGIDRSVEDGRGGHLRGPQGRDHRVRLPVAARRVIRSAGPPRASGIAPQQIRGDAGFVNEHIGPGVVDRQGLCPPPPRGGDVSATLFAGAYGFF